MLAAAGFCGGFVARHQCNRVECTNENCKQFHEDCSQMQLRCTAYDSIKFRLSVRVVSASIPGLAPPGLVVRQRPRVELWLGGQQRETNFGEFSGESGVDCPWRFGDTLTWAANLGDVIGPGLQVRVQAYNDFRLGPLSLELARGSALGECVIDVRSRILPSCVQATRCDPDGSCAGQHVDGSYWIWESPVMIQPLMRSAGSVWDAAQKAEAHLTLAFVVTADPEPLRRLAEQAEKSMANRIVAQLGLVDNQFEGKDDSLDMESPQAAHASKDVLGAVFGKIRRFPGKGLEPEAEPHPRSSEFVAPRAGG